MQTARSAALRLAEIGAINGHALLASDAQLVVAGQRRTASPEIHFPTPRESALIRAMPAHSQRPPRQHPSIHPLHPRRWTPLRLQVFLAMLDATGSVGAAVAAAGMSRQSAYRLRARRPELAVLWTMAERAGRGLPPAAPITPGDAGLHRVTAGDAE